tara:strand:+ start:122 stop:640 length:519 start_codon:yes stop_codon:yes gene_type:complete
MANNWRAIGQYTSLQELNETSTTQHLPLGTTVKAKSIAGASTDTVLGEGEFIYLLGVASTVAYDFVTFVAATYQTIRPTANAVGLGAFAYSANVASQYGWYQIRGIAEANVAASFAAAKIPYLTATASVLDDAVVAGDKVYNTLSMSAIGTPVTGNAYIYCHAPPMVTNESN